MSSTTNYIVRNDLTGTYLTKSGYLTDDPAKAKVYTNVGHAKNAIHAKRWPAPWKTRPFSIIPLRVEILLSEAFPFVPDED